jgi:hypothetical protein
MSTGTGVQVIVDLLEKTVNYTVNILFQLAYRIEGGRGLSGAGYMSRLHEVIERGFRAWISEQKLLFVRFQLYDPTSNKAYEIAQVNLTYTADPTEKAVKPPIEQLEAVMKELNKLPPDAKFSVIVQNAPGASEVPGWQPSEFKELMGGVAEEIEVGDEEHGFGHVAGRVVYTISNWGEKQHDQHNGVNNE